MPSQSPQAPTPSPFEITTPAKSKKGNKGLIIAILVVVFLILSVVVGVILVRQNQNIAEKAVTTGDSNFCPAVEACPAAGNPSLLINCTPGETGSDPSQSTCNVTGRIESCGGAQYCCPASNGAWTTNMTACTAAVITSPSPTATSSASPTATASASPTGSASPTAVPTLGPASTSPTAQSTSLPIPVTGTDWPTVVGAGLGVFVIIASILIAL
ncbi:MAG TPA: hypothetical protein VFI61_02705 [Patescibacteria group bacterium]|nr:hypothetical protein [Patescibacteria group bacterium]